MRKCIICGAKVKNINKAVVTCGPDCTAKKNGEPDPDIVFNVCRMCGLAIDDNSKYCIVCKEYVPY